MPEPSWEHCPLVAQEPSAPPWLTIQANLGLAVKTVDAYGRALQDYLAFSQRQGITTQGARRGHIAAYVHELTQRPNPRRTKGGEPHPGRGLANATLQQRLTAVRLYYDYLVEEGLRADSPVGRGRYTAGRGFGGQRDRGLLPRYRTLPWVPTDAQWRAAPPATRAEPLRDRVMLAMAYDAGLRRQEVCSLRTGDLDPATRLLRIRAEATKGRRERVVPYSAPTSELLAAYLEQRATISSARGPLFLSESQRNYGQPISLWTWTKVVERTAPSPASPPPRSPPLPHRLGPGRLGPPRDCGIRRPS